MAGHSKWANIKHKKGAADQKRGKIFSRITKEIYVAVKNGGGGDTEQNATLRAAVIAAKAANMPSSNVDRAIKKALGDSDTSTFEEIAYEGYGPEGVAILVETLTDNRNRTSGEIRYAFDRNCGNMAASGAVTWMFHRKSHFVITGEHADEDALLEVLIKIATSKVTKRRYPHGTPEGTIPDLSCFALNIVQIAQFLYLKQGAEGEISHSEMGISRSYENADIPQAYYDGIIPYVGIPS